MFKELKDRKDDRKKRFTVKEEQSYGLGYISVVVDTSTGVNYMLVGSGSSINITPLLDNNGKIIVDEITDK
ncbi:MAG: DUF6440 family protein [Oscillospiraceae bacterium]|nr:DUF6440 family protein [Oscillospiraceae bacterium]